jgi:uncharacterized protein (TIGR03790 family)
MGITIPSKNLKGPLFWILMILWWILVMPCMALESYEMVIIANKKVADSVALAQFYINKRNIPKANLLQLPLSDREECTREEYEQKVVPTVRNYLAKKNSTSRIRCLVTMYGLPLKISGSKMTPQEKKQVNDLRIRRKSLKNQLKKFEGQKDDHIKTVKTELKSINEQLSILTGASRRSSFDSELALVLEENYAISGWIPNPYFIGFRDEKNLVNKDNVLMVSRLDGPSVATVKRIIQDSIKAEKNGLQGTAYFDARWAMPKKQKLSGYAFYDNSIHLAADRIRESNLLPVVVNNSKELFQPGEAPDAALYCGWYSLANYVDAFIWKPGAVGYHIASSECVTLKKRNSRVWCKMMLEKGIAATIGPVGEPYVEAFPIPEVFFGLLIDGNLSLAECYQISLPYLSWKMVLIGDPLYRPFKNLIGKD